MNFNYLILLIAKFFYKFFPIGKTRIFNLIIKLSIKNWKYSYYNVKIINQNFNDLTYRLSLGGGYGDYYSNYLKKLSNKFIFLDFGSNLGIYSLISNRNKNCKYIYAFDPLPMIKKIILENFKLNNVRGKFFNIGIYKKDIRKKLYISKNHSGSSSLIRGSKSQEYIKVQFKNSIFLKKEISNLKKKKFIIKIDVEGVEYDIIKELKKINILDNTFSIFLEIRAPNAKLKKQKISTLLKKYNIVLKKFVKPHDYLYEKL
jgi:FkbM family methyltransferase